MRCATSRVRILGAVALLALASTSARAQDPGGQPPDGGRAPDAAAARDTVQRSPFEIVLAARQQLQLSLEQAKGITDISLALSDSNGPRMREIETLRAESQLPPGGYASMSSDQLALVRQQRQQLAALLAQVRDNEQTAWKNALALLTPAQQRQAQTLIAEARTHRDAGRSPDGERRGRGGGRRRGGMGGGMGEPPGG